MNTEEVLEDLNRQAQKLNECFGLGTSFNEDWVRAAIPEISKNGAEKFYLCPLWNEIASTYGDAFLSLMSVLKKKRRFSNYIFNDDVVGNLRQTQETKNKVSKLADNQGRRNNVIIPAQIGLKFKGFSTAQALSAMGKKEFGLDSFTVGIIILTHLEYLSKRDDLWIICSGDEFKIFNNSDYYGFSLCYETHFYKSMSCRTELDRSRRNRPEKNSGVASGFVI